MMPKSLLSEQGKDETETYNLKVSDKGYKTRFVTKSLIPTKDESSYEVNFSNDKRLNEVSSILILLIHDYGRLMSYKYV